MRDLSTPKVVEYLLKAKHMDWYIFQLHGAVFVSWVSAQDKDNACRFSADKVDGWEPILEEMGGVELVIEKYCENA